MALYTIKRCRLNSIKENKNIYISRVEFFCNVFKFKAIYVSYKIFLRYFLCPIYLSLINNFNDTSSCNMKLI